MNKQERDLNLDGNTFDAMKNDFNDILKKTLSSMESKESHNAEITLKMKISFQNITVPDFTKEDKDALKTVTTPQFEHKVSTVLRFKGERSGTLSGRNELVFDAERGEYIMREIPDSQMNLFESDEQTDVCELCKKPRPHCDKCCAVCEDKCNIGQRCRK